MHYVGRVGLDHVKKKVLDDADEPQARCGSGCSSRSTASPTRGSSSSKAQVDVRQFAPRAA